jgi:DNA-binding transcriptional LysR family regulator
MASPRITSDALAAFVVFAEHLNLTKAAGALHISQPSLHAKLATLARELGRPLYRRIGRRLALTPDGEAVARFARDHDDRLNRFLDELRATPPTRPIVLAAGHAAYLHILGDVIRTTLATQPGRLRLLHTNRTEMMNAVRTGLAHLGVAVLDVSPDDLVVVPVATYPNVLLVADSHRLAHRRSVQLRSLAGEQLIVPPPGKTHRAGLERAMRTAEIPFSVAVETDSWPLTVHFARLGVGLAIVTGCITPPDGVTAVRVADLPTVTYHAVYRPGALDDPRVRDLLTAIRASVRRSTGKQRARTPAPAPG